MKKGKVFKGNVLIMEQFQDAQLEDGRTVCEACLFEHINKCIRDRNSQRKSVYEGAAVVLNKPVRGSVKRYKIYIEDPRTSDVRRVDFGAKNLTSKEKPRKFRTVHKCGDPNDPNSHWSCLE